ILTSSPTATNDVFGVTRREAWVTGFDRGAGVVQRALPHRPGGLVSIGTREVSSFTLSGADFQELEDVKGLVARGLQVGALTHRQIAAATAELDLEESDLEELHGVLEQCEIELVEELDPATAAALDIERAPEKRTRGKAPLDLRPEGTTDALQLFLKDI